MKNILTEKTSKKLNKIIKQNEETFPIIKFNQDNFNYVLLTTPLQIHISKEVSKKIITNYKENEEIGGWLFAKFIESGLIINDLEIVKNISSNKLSSYKPELKEDLNALENKIINQNEFYYPLRFHTHPFLKTAINKTNFDTSENDQNLSIGYIKSDKCWIIVPNALITKINNQKKDYLFGIFGGYIAPDNFFKEKLNRMSNGIADIAQLLGVKNNDLCNVIGAFSSVFLEFKLPGFKNILTTMGVSEDLKNYFVNLDMTKNVILELPKFNKDK